MGLFKKKSVPAELPSLAMDDLAKSNLSVAPAVVASPVSMATISAPVIPQVPAVSTSVVKALPVVTQQTPSQTAATIKEQVSASDEAGYFKNLVKSVTEGAENVEKLTSWYENKFAPGDMVFQMREYWQKQQPELLLKNISGELKNKLMEKTDKLHGLEKEWQEIYFTLLNKEEQIRKEEKELKESLAEFINLVKRPSEEKN